MIFHDLLTERLELTFIDESGLEDMYEYSRDPRLYQYMEISAHDTIEDTKDYYNKLTERVNEGAHYWFINDKEDKKVIGSLGVTNIDLNRMNCEIGYAISANYWGRGYFVEVLEKVLDYLAKEKGFVRVSAVTHSENMPSKKSLERCGFSKEGVMRKYYKMRDGERASADIYAYVM